MFIRLPCFNVDSYLETKRTRHPDSSHASSQEAASIFNCYLLKITIKDMYTDNSRRHLAGNLGTNRQCTGFIQYQAVVLHKYYGFSLELGEL